MNFERTAVELTRDAPQLRKWEIGMRRLMLFVVFASACANPHAPSASLSGTWSENISIPGASLVLMLDASGSGQGRYSIEAGRSGTVQVVGVSVSPRVVFSIVYDYGLTRTFVGTLTDANHLTGAFDAGSGTVVFTRS